MARNKYDIDEQLNVPFNWQQFKRIFSYTKPYKKKLIVTLIVMLAASALNLLAPMILRNVIDVQIPEKNITMLLIMSGAYTLLVIFAACMTAYRMRSTNRIGQGIIHDIRLDMFRHLQKLPFTYFDDRPHGKILVRIVNYVNTISDLISTGMINAVVDMFSLIIILIYMVIIDPILTLIALCGLPLLALGIILIKKQQRRAYQQLSMKQSNMNAYMQESLIGMKVTQAFAREETNRGIFDRVLTEYRKSWMKSTMLGISVWPFVETISNGTISLLYLIGVLSLRGQLGDRQIEVGTIVAFVSYVRMFWTPVNNMMNFYNQLVNSAAYMERICEFLDEPTVIDDKAGAVELQDIRGDVEFDHVTFGYEEGQTVLKDLSFKVKPGQTIALVGPTGAGKSTVVNLISRFYDVCGGAIRIDGTDIRDVTLESLRRNQGIMLQEPFLFPTTIMENIRYGRLDATDEECIAAAKAVCADEFIRKMPYGYHTYIRQNGGGVSAGERQMISFARVMLADPKLVILDEATSSIDTQTEKAVQQGLEVMLRGRTSFVIAHRLSTIRNADVIFYIANNTIAESGTHDELMAKKGLYYNLYQSQLQELI